MRQKTPVGQMQTPQSMMVTNPRALYEGDGNRTEFNKFCKNIVKSLSGFMNKKEILEEVDIKAHQSHIILC